jgi:hypothetical protein
MISGSYPTNKFSDPSGTNTPSEWRYSRKAGGRGLMIFERIVVDANFGYHVENWKASKFCGFVVEKSSVGRVMMKARRKMRS